MCKYFPVQRWESENRWYECLQSSQAKDVRDPNRDTLLRKPLNMERQAVWHKKWYLVIRLHFVRNDDVTPSFHGFQHVGTLQKSYERNLPQNFSKIFQKYQKLGSNDAPDWLKLQAWCNYSPWLHIEMSNEKVEHSNKLNNWRRGWRAWEQVLTREQKICDKNSESNIWDWSKFRKLRRWSRSRPYGDNKNAQKVKLSWWYPSKSKLWWQNSQIKLI